MSFYKVKKYDEIDEFNLLNLYEYLESHPACLKSLFENTRGQNNHHASKIGALDQQDARGSSAGTVLYRGEKVISKLSLEHPKLDNLLIKFMNHHNPDFIYDSVYITKNCQSKPHKDSNPGNSIIAACGAFDQGGLIVEESFANNILFDIKKMSVEFDGSKHKHWTDSFVREGGSRYSFIFY